MYQNICKKKSVQCFADFFIAVVGHEIRVCRVIITAPSHAKLKVQYPPPPTALLRMRGGAHMLIYVHPFVLPTVNRPYKLNIHIVLY
jgi:hypothetical protein